MFLLYISQMAIFHFSVKVISRADGRNAVSAAAYRHGAKMVDERTGQTFDYSKKSDVAHTEISVPNDAPEWAKALIDLDPTIASEKLWNSVEKFEKRKDAQLSRDLEYALPNELNSEQRKEVARDFIEKNFTSKGMIADWVIHNPIDEITGIEKPHVHIQLTLRSLREKTIIDKAKSVMGISSQEILFGEKNRKWNSRSLIRQWREDWADVANKHLEKSGFDVRIDHRNYKDQGVDFVPQEKLGKNVQEMQKRGIEVDRFKKFKENNLYNLKLIRQNPEIVLEYITRYQSTFTRQDIAKVLNRYIDDADEFIRLQAKIELSQSLVVLTGENQKNSQKLTTQEMIKVESEMTHLASKLSKKHSCPPHLSGTEHYLQKAHEKFKDSGGLSSDQVSAIRHLVADGQLKVVIGYAGAGKTTALEIAKEIWGFSSYKVVGAAPTGRAASNLEIGGIASKTLHKWEHEWKNGREQLNNRSILVVDEAGMIDSRRINALLQESSKQGFKVVLVGDPEQLAPIEAGAAVRGVMEHVGFVELNTIVRQKEQWQREATRDLATRQTERALEAYHQRGHIYFSGDAKQVLIKDWAKYNQTHKDQSSQNLSAKRSALILAYTNKDVASLNEMARLEFRKGGNLEGVDQILTVTKKVNLETLDNTQPIQKPTLTKEDRAFAIGEKIIFLQNDYSLDVRNGQLGKIIQIQEGLLTVEKEDSKRLTFDIDTYGYIDYGYATTIHKSQAATVDQTFFYASPSLDRHLTYVGLTRHRDDARIYGDQFYTKDGFIKSLSQENTKEISLDYPKAQEMSLEMQKSFMQRRNISAASIVEAFYGYVKKAWSYGREEKSIRFETFEKAEAYKDVSTQTLFNVKATHKEWEEIAEVDLEKMAFVVSQSQLSSSTVADVQSHASEHSFHPSSLETRVASPIDPDEISVSINATKSKFSHAIDFSEVNTRLSSRMPDLVQHVFKGQSLQIRKNTIRVGKKGSIVINVTGEKQGQWYNFEEDVGGNALTFLTHHLNMTPKDAALYASNFIGDLPERTIPTSSLKPQESPKDTSEAPTWTPVFPVPASKGNPDLESNSHLNYVFKSGAVETMRFAYLDENKDLLGYVVRIEDTDGNKQTLPLTYCQNEKGHTFWKWQGFGENRPLYGLDKLADHPDKPVLIVEGEKAADAAQKLFSDHVVVTWLGGTGGVRKANFDSLVGKDITIWPDNDEAGLKAAHEIKKIISKLNENNDRKASVDIVEIPRDRLPLKWDLADPLPEGMILSEIQSYVAKKDHSLTATITSKQPIIEQDFPETNLNEKVSHKDAEQSLLDRYIVLQKQKEELPYLTKCTPQQKEDFVVFGKQLEALAMKISENPELMQNAAAKGIIDKIKDHAEIGREDIARALIHEQNAKKKEQESLKRPEENFVEVFSDLKKQREALPFVTLCTQEQKQEILSLSRQMEKIATKIEETPELMEKAVSKGIAEQVKDYALMHKETQHRNKTKSHDRDRGMSYF
jgi:Ti-type conjugative transfer relaxase TraA